MAGMDAGPCSSTSSSLAVLASVAVVMPVRKRLRIAIAIAARGQAGWMKRWLIRAHAENGRTGLRRLRRLRLTSAFNQALAGWAGTASR